MSIQEVQQIPKGFDPNKADNHEDIEKQFAVVAVKHAQIHWGLLVKLDPSVIRFTKIDDDIYNDFAERFPELVADISRISKVNEDEMKSKSGKERWRNFIQSYEKKVNDYNFGTLLRTDARGEYNEKNTIFVTRMQFLAIEIARNRLGLNQEIADKAKEDER